MSSSEEEEEEEEENVSDMKTLTSGGGDLPQEFWQVGNVMVPSYKSTIGNTHLYCNHNVLLIIYIMLVFKCCFKCEILEKDKIDFYCLRSIL